MATAIEFEHVGKQYRLGLVSTKTLSHDLNRWWQTSILGKEDPYLKIGETNDRSVAGNSEYVWALRDIDFKVEQGDVVGIIGKNGAGKSTLLKLLSKVTGPTVGTIRARGRIGSLLEVGTGFHGEMTGRENIYMNGAIMGMTRNDITQKLDEIIEFSGCERYIDTPVKRYSSGMTVRLGFAVAAHLEPEILVVDEVLAVGDAEFQKKAIGKMQDVSRGEGRTVLFVSHNMASIRALCHNGILLENGSIKYTGDIESVVLEYQRTNQQYITSQIADRLDRKAFENAGTGADFVPIKELAKLAREGGLPMENINLVLSSMGLKLVDLQNLGHAEMEKFSGQLNGIGRMLDENRYCGDILIQISAVERALQGFGYTVLKSHMESCVVEEVLNGNSEIMAQTLELMKKLK